MLVVFFLLLVQSVGRSDGATYNCSEDYNRLPDDSDIAVTCGPSNINLSIQACPAAFANFDPELLALNGRHNDSRCLGVLDTSGSTPVIRYMLPVSDMPERTCGSRIHIIDAPGTGEFMDYSKVQSLLFTGFVDTPSLSGGSLISYSTNLYFNFSCLYPMQYLLKNSPLMTSFGAVAVNSNNGSFLSTLSMTLFIDASFTTPLNLNGTAYALRTKMYVQVAATNLTSNFSVLLDQCFATPSPLVTTASDRYNLFAGCDQQNKTNIIKNGVGILAQFSFEAFRFVAHSGQKSSTSYLHCVTRLCQPDQCLQYLQACNNGAPSLRKKRASSTSAQGTTDPVMVSSGPLSIKDTEATSSQVSIRPDNSHSDVKQLEGTLTGLIIGVVVAVILGAGLVIACVASYKICLLRAAQAKCKA